jgi:hypothetical protein
MQLHETSETRLTKVSALQRLRAVMGMHRDLQSFIRALIGRQRFPKQIDVSSASMHRVQQHVRRT